MSKLYEPAYASPTGALVKPAGHYAVLAWGTAAPSATASEYEKGCIYINTGGTIGTLVYVNTGTVAAPVWTAIL